MRLRKVKRFLVGGVGLSVWAAGTAEAADVTPVDLDVIALGAKIVGPVGPEVQTTFVNENGQGIGDLESSVSCPDGFADCTPATNPAGTVYTYVHTVIPGVDLANDPPFPAPGEVIDFNDVTGFKLTFAAAGFNGVAGYRFADADAALGDQSTVAIEHLPDGSLSWSVSNDEWDTGEAITFFWQTTQSPSGPGGQYQISDGAVTGLGAGPLPIPVPEPGTIGVFIALAVLGTPRKTVRQSLS